MTSPRRQQNTPADGQNLEDLDALLDRQIKQEKSRQEYQKRPEVVEKRKDYQTKQMVQRQIARAAMKGDRSKLISLGLSEEHTEHAIQKATEMQQATQEPVGVA